MGSNGSRPGCSARLSLKMKREVTLKGIPASSGIARGKAKILTSPRDINKVCPGDVIVAPSTNPLFTPAILIASAIVTEVGGVLSHAAIVSREAGIPCVVGVKNATKIIQDNQMVEVNGQDGLIKTLSPHH